VTLIVQLLLARANRFAFLLGGTNALIYGISYFDEGLYFSVISAILISAPIQIYSFFNWSKKQTSANHTELKTLSTKMRIAVLIATVAAWLTILFGFSGLFKNAQLPAFDSFGFVAGTVVSILAAFRFVESQYISAFSCCLHIIMWIIICTSNPSNINYLIISVYNLFMVVKAAINWTKLYIQDKKEKVTT
jgi:nicotinamide mononucleotide transporter PnuC